MKLTFMNSQNVERELAIVPNIDEAERVIRKFLEDHNFKFYYFKVSLFPNKMVYDVGSWSEFFILYNKDDVELNTIPLWQEKADE